jgi:Holliday junction resolvase
MIPYIKTFRLRTVARDFNTSFETIIEILKKNKYKIDKHPNAKLDLQMYYLIEKEFSKTYPIRQKYKEKTAMTKNHKEEERILNIINKGEDKTSEFKETFNRNKRTKLKDNKIQKSALKNIVGFLNSDGGTLLIGVDDNGVVTGIEDDFYKSDDKYLLNFRNAIHTKVGSQFYSLIDWDIFEINGKKILKVECQKSNEPCFYGDVEFFVRTNPATDKLEGKKQYEYIKKRF